MNVKRFDILAALVAIYSVALVVANIIAGKLWATPLPSVVLTAGVIIFPIVYIIGDVVPEVYGLAVARRIIWLGFLANLIAVAAFWLTLRLPWPPFFEGQKAFEVVLGFTPRLLLASFLGYIVGTNANALVLVWMKKLTGPKLLWSRTIGSTIVGEGLDSLVFMSVAFWGIVPLAVLPGMIVVQWLFKTGYEVLVTPLTYVIVNKVKALEGVDG
jgi:uncharacterized integral membrane protein (TIGR00697 family)